MLRLALLLSVALVVVHANAIYDIHEDIIHEEWEAFKVEHKKDYLDDREEEYRRKIYIENRKKIANHNKKASSNGGPTFYLKMNEYGNYLNSFFFDFWKLISKLSRCLALKVTCCTVTS
jgi:cathepsin L